jgi:O-antigen ligase
VRENLVHTYEERNFQSGVDAAFNAHNQYLQTWLMIGLPGLLALLVVMVQTGLDAWRNNRPERTAAIVFLGMAMMSEAMLERQMGVLPFAFFVALWAVFPTADYGIQGPGNEAAAGCQEANRPPLPDSSPLKKAVG